MTCCQHKGTHPQHAEPANPSENRGDNAIHHQLESVSRCNTNVECNQRSRPGSNRVPDLLGGQDHYFRAISDLAARDEFYPSSEKVRRFAKERHRQMTEAMEQASKKSIFRQIATEIPLKAGRRTFRRFNGRYTELTELKGISHSIPVPRTEIADPMGSQRERYLFRRVKKGEP